MIETGDNLRAIAEKLRKLSKAVPKIVSGVLRVWGAQTADHVAEYAPKDTGNLARSIAYETSDGPPPEVVIQAGAPYAAAVEFGTMPHEIAPRSREVLRFPNPGGAGWAFAPVVDHPGTDPQPFFFDTIDRDVDHLDSMTADAIALALHEVGLDDGGSGL